MRDARQTTSRIVGGESKSERDRVRMEMAAERLLENVLRRRRWAAQDRDAIAAFLGSLVDEEVRQAAASKGIV